MGDGSVIWSKRNLPKHTWAGGIRDVIGRHHHATVTQRHLSRRASLPLWTNSSGKWNQVMNDKGLAENTEQLQLPSVRWLSIKHINCSFSLTIQIYSKFWHIYWIISISYSAHTDSFFHDGKRSKVSYDIQLLQQPPLSIIQRQCWTFCSPPINQDCTKNTNLNGKEGRWRCRSWLKPCISYSHSLSFPFQNEESDG